MKSTESKEKKEFRELSEEELKQVNGGTTGAAKAIGLVIPELDGNLNGSLQTKVPGVTVSSVVD